MEKKVTAWIFLLMLVPGISAIADDIPSDLSPFVRLGHLVKLSLYKNPVFDKEHEKIIDKGELSKEEIFQMPLGSGTIISPDGMILTNYHVFQMSERVQFDESRNVLLVAQPVSQTMIVYALQDNDALKPPVPSFIAVPISLDEEHDIALLKITGDQNGGKLPEIVFSHVNIGNPFEMRLNEIIHILGFPAKGGDTITITEGRFLGYYRDQAYFGLDGFIKTNAAMAPGNSGGAAVNKSRYVGIPTAITHPALAGSDLGFIYPVTWALKALVVAVNKHGYSSPLIPLSWLLSEYNTDETRKNAYITGVLISANSNTPVSATVVMARKDRTLEQVNSLHNEVQTIIILNVIQQLYESGITKEEIAQRFQLSQEEVEKILKIKLLDKNIHQDTVQYLNGDFFYTMAFSDEAGFFILSVPRGRDVKLYVLQEGLNPFERDLKIEKGISQNMGTIKLYYR